MGIVVVVVRMPLELFVRVVVECAGQISLRWWVVQEVGRLQLFVVGHIAVEVGQSAGWLRVEAVEVQHVVVVKLLTQSAARGARRQVSSRAVFHCLP